MVIDSIVTSKLCADCTRVDADWYVYWASAHPGFPFVLSISEGI